MKRVKGMAKRTCELNKKQFVFPEDCKECVYLKPRGKMLCCSYKLGEAKKA